MDGKERFYKKVLQIALPVTLQSLLQSSFSVVDQLMIGKLGSASIAGVGLGAKFASLYSVLLGAVVTVAGITISQYVGQKEEKEISRSFFVNLFLASGLAIAFAVISICFPNQIMWLYTKDIETRQIAAAYLRLYALSYLPMAVSMMFATLLRCTDAAVFPLYASVLSAVMNTGLNYVLIFGKLGLPKLGARGAAIATVISQTAACILIFCFFVHIYRKWSMRLYFVWWFDRAGWKLYQGILLPILACEFLWSLGENVYAAIYGNLGTKACAAMTLTIPVQTLVMGAMSGLGQAAGIITGKTLGSRDYDRAYAEAKKFIWGGLAGAAVLAVLLLAVRNYYVRIYEVEDSVQILASRILVVFALISPVKIQNMILGGGIVRSGGKTKYIMWVDMIGTWIFGVPLGLVGAFVLKLSIPYVYLLLSLEECVRLGITLVIFRKKVWMESL